MALDRDDLFTDSDGDDWEGDETGEGDMLVGLDTLLAQYVGYEVHLKGSNPVQMRIVRPSTPASSAVLVGSYSDCLVVREDASYTIIPYPLVIVSVPRDEWDSQEWSEE